MKTLTISQPFASLIATGDKWVENRTWKTDYRGPLAIHAGRGTQYLTGKQLRDFPTGAIVAVATLWGCLDIRAVKHYAAGGDIEDPELFAGFGRNELVRIANHEHSEGPFGFLLRDIYRLETPVDAVGKLGFWETSPDVSAAIASANLIRTLRGAGR